MIASPIDPRNWNDPSCRVGFRVYFWHQPEDVTLDDNRAQGSPRSTEWLLEDATLQELLVWLPEHAPINTIRAELFCDLWMGAKLVGSAAIGEWQPS